MLDKQELEDGFNNKLRIEKGRFDDLVAYKDQLAKDNN